MALLWFDTLWSSMLGRHTEHVTQGVRRSRPVLWTHRLLVQRNCDATACHFPSLVTSVLYISDCCACVSVFCSMIQQGDTCCTVFISISFSFMQRLFHLVWASYVFHVSDSKTSRAAFTFKALPRFAGWKHPFILVLLVSFLHYSIGGQEISLNVKSYQLPHE